MLHLIASLKNLMMKNYHGLVLVLVIVLASGAAQEALGAAAVKQMTFSSPEEGVQAANLFPITATITNCLPDKAKTLPEALTVI